MKKLIAKKFVAFAWLLTLLVAILAFTAWAGGLNWQLDELTSYKLFPVFGLTAFSLMWVMYVVGFANRQLAAKAKLKDYYKVMGWLVVLAIVFHPSLLIWQLWRDGLGLPPGSYLGYVGPTLKWAALLGTASLLIFLAYELHRLYRGKSWWRYIEYGVDAAMVAIFIHGLRLGGQLAEGWFRYVWFFYGAVLLVILLDKYILGAQPKKNGHSKQASRRSSNLAKNQKLLIFVAIAGVAFMALGVATGKQLTNGSTSSAKPVECVDQLASDFGCWRTYFQYQVATEDPKEALIEAKQLYASNDYIRSQCHQIAHVIGRAGGKKYEDLAQAYAKGTDFCWSGYYHGVVEAVAYKQGAEKFIEDINNTCSSLKQEKPYKFSHYNCVHGLGHGLMAIQGNELFESLKSCDRLSDAWEQESCYGGVFMENIMSEFNADHSTAYLRDDDLLYPCTAVGVEYLTQCYLMQTSHALKVTGYDFSKVFQVCAEVEAPYDETCFTSLGRDASGNTVSDASRTKELCLLGPTPAAQKNCIVGAVLDFVSFFHNDDEALAFCAIIDSPEVRETCDIRAKAHFATF